MIVPMPIYLRAHTEISSDKRRRSKPKKNTPKCPDYALVFDCETLLDASQAMILCCYEICRLDDSGRYGCVEEGLVFADEATAEERMIIRQYATHQNAIEGNRHSKIRVLDRTEFIEKVFYKLAYDADALICGFNLPFDLCRLALDARKARGSKGWSLVMSQYRDKKTRRLRENPFRPRITITPKDSKAAFISLTGCKDGAHKRGRFLDLRTLAWALRNESYSLDSACKGFGVPGKLDHHPSGRVTPEEIDYCRQDVRASVALLNAELAEFNLHRIELLPEQAISPASIGKGYLEAMGVIPPLEKFQIPPSILGIAMQAYFGGRAECRIRNTNVPVALVDFTSQYPAVNALMDLQNILVAEDVRIENATDDVRTMLARLSLPDTLNPELWKQLSWFALVRPADDILPVRTTYSADTYNIGLNHLKSEKPIWFSGPDVVAGTLLTGKAPEILRAIRIVPRGKQRGLKPILFRGETFIDPRKMDFFKAVIEARALAKEKRQDALAYSLKILANATSYGLFVEVNPARAATRKNVQVFSGEDQFPSSTDTVEPKGRWYFPPIAALITGGGRLLLAILECVVRDADGTYLFADTDSMGIVAKERGGLAPCIGGPHRIGGVELVKVLSFNDVRGIVSLFDRLNPYDRRLVPHILKIEKMQPGLNGYAISTKRYALYSRELGSLRIEKASEHGLGYLFPPKHGFNEYTHAPEWIEELWQHILREAESLPLRNPSWFDAPAMMRFTVTTPQVLRPLQRLQTRMPYRRRTKPYNFVLSPILNRFVMAALQEPITLITPFTTDPCQLARQQWINIHDGKIFRQISIPVETFGDVARDFRFHKESKSCGPDGKPCDFDTRGLLKRTHVTACATIAHGKETDRQWQHGGDFSLLFPLLPVYRPHETEKMVSDPILPSKARGSSIRDLATKTGLSTRTIRSARNGKRLRKSTIRKIEEAVSGG